MYRSQQEVDRNADENGRDVKRGKEEGRKGSGGEGDKGKERGRKTKERKRREKRSSEKCEKKLQTLKIVKSGEKKNVKRRHRSQSKILRHEIIE